MMKNYTTRILLLAALAVAGCAKSAPEPEQEPEQTTRTVTLNAGVEQTKANVDNSTGAFTWASGDKIGVYTSDGKIVAFTLNDDDNGKTNGRFSAELATGVNIQDVAVFPYHDGDSYDPATREFTYNLPASHAWNANWKNRSMPAMYARISGEGGLSFKHLGGIVRIPIQNLASEATVVEFVSTGKRINGAFTFDLDDASPQLTAQDNGGEESITSFTFTAPGRTGTTWTFNVPVPAGNYTKWDVKSWKSKSGNLARESISSTRDRTIAAADLMRMPTLVFGYRLNDFEDGLLPANYVNSDYSALSVVENPDKTGDNTSSYVLKNEKASGSGWFHFLAKNEYYYDGFRNNVKAFKMSFRYHDSGDAAIYVPWIHVGNNEDYVAPTQLNGVVLGSPLTAETWAGNVKADGWNTVIFEGGNFTSIDRVRIRTFTKIDHTSSGSSGSRILYMDNFEFLK